MLFRLYQPGDFAALYAVEELCFQPPVRFGRTYMRRIIQNPRSATWIAEENAQLVAFAVVEWAEESGQTAAYIETLEVHPELRRHGIGAELLRLVEKSAQAAGAKSIWLHVDQENSSAIGLYQNRGFAFQGREENYYARNRPALVYSKSLEGDWRAR